MSWTMASHETGSFEQLLSLGCCDIVTGVRAHGNNISCYFRQLCQFSEGETAVRFHKSRRLWIAVLAVAPDARWLRCATARAQRGPQSQPVSSAVFFTSASVPSGRACPRGGRDRNRRGRVGVASARSVTGTVRMTFTEPASTRDGLEAADRGGATRGHARRDNETAKRLSSVISAGILHQHVRNTGLEGNSGHDAGDTEASTAPQLVFPGRPRRACGRRDRGSPPKPSPSQSLPVHSQMGHRLDCRNRRDRSRTRSKRHLECPVFDNFELHSGRPERGIFGVADRHVLERRSGRGVLQRILRARCRRGRRPSRLVKAVTGPVLNAIKTIAAVPRSIAQVVSYLNLWSVKVAANPSSVEAGSGERFDAQTVNTGTGGLSYPPP